MTQNSPSNQSDKELPPRRGLIAGSFDPITWGHVDVIARAVSLFDEVHVVVTHNPSKSTLFTVETRVRLAQESLREWDAQHGTLLAETVRISVLNGGLLANYAKSLNIGFLVRGLRNGTDFEYERPLAAMNHHLAGLETIYMTANPQYTAVSSSLIKEVGRLGGDISTFVAACVQREMVQMSTN